MIRKHRKKIFHIFLSRNLEHIAAHNVVSEDATNRGCIQTSAHWQYKWCRFFDLRATFIWKSLNSRPSTWTSAILQFPTKRHISSLSVVWSTVWDRWWVCLFRSTDISWKFIHSWAQEETHDCKQVLSWGTATRPLKILTIKTKHQERYWSTILISTQGAKQENMEARDVDGVL